MFDIVVPFVPFEIMVVVLSWVMMTKAMLLIDVMIPLCHFNHCDGDERRGRRQYQDILDGASSIKGWECHVCDGMNVRTRLE